ncbi:MAG TPA: glycosyltransferase family 87 protein [Allosphingosinicella sp.]|nr:glycosyltransferase family 87 protein [Allosphingosinicella sp.]
MTRAPQERLRLPMMAVALLFLFVAVLALVTVLRDPYQMDFISYWAAARLGLEGNPAAAYDFATHRAVELQATMVGGLPFGYPPSFMLLVAPFALFSYPIGAVGWVVVTFALYALAVRWWRPDLLWPALAMPPVLINAITGQAGFLTAAMFLGGAALLPRRPFAGGLLLGLLVIKPQLGLILPLALLAGRQWRAIAGAAVSSVGLLLIGLIAFGWRTYEAWIGQAGLFASVASEGLAGWHRMASVYAAARFAGLDAGPAWILHGLVALAALAAALWVWHRHADWGARIAALAAATVLASPYMFGYDTLILVAPFAWLIARGRHLVPATACWAVLLLGLLQALGWSAGPNLAPLAPIVLLGLVVFELRRDQRDGGLSASASEAVALPRRAGAG